MGNLFRELRQAARTLTKSPGFAAIAILTLALGIGAATSIFSVVDAVLLRALPYPDPQNLVRVWEQAPDGHRMNIADPNFDDFRTQNETFASLAAYAGGLDSVSGGSEPVRVGIAVVSRDFFKTMGVEPARGRGFLPDEMKLNGARAAIVSHAYWQKYLGAAADLTKFHLTMEGAAYSIAGVMPEGFDFPAGTAVWVPRELDPETPSRSAHNWRGVGRLRAGVTIAQARANLGAIARRIKNQYSKDADLSDAAVVPLADAMVGDVRTALVTLLGAVGLLLMIACANVAGLLLARTSARSKELAVRAALGAGRGRLIVQFLAESFALSFAGGVLGILLASWTIHALPAILPANLPRQQSIEMSTQVVAFGIAAMFAVALALGLFAAWRAGRGDLQAALTAGSRSHTGSGATQRFRGFVVIGEIAMTLMILAGAGLLGRSFLQLISTNPGFNARNLITMEFSPPAAAEQAGDDQAARITMTSAAARQIHLLDQILDRVRAIPGVENAGLTGALPVAGGDSLSDGTFLILNSPEPPADFKAFGRMAHNPAQSGQAAYGVAGEDYFRTLGIPLIRGRMFNGGDQWNTPHVALISESLARKRWPNEDPLGKLIEFGNMDGNLKPMTIVGIVGDVRERGLDAPPGPVIYVDYRQRGIREGSSPTILVRGAGSLSRGVAREGGIVSAARGIFHDLAPDAPVKFSTFDDELGGWLANRRFLLLLVGVFAAAALLLAAVGIYGVVAFSVARRTQEIGVRMALGAGRADVLRMILGEGARLAFIGVAIGVAASLAVTRLLSSLLFGIGAADPATFIGVAALLAMVALVASYIPALRAMRLDPNAALRHE